MRVAGRRSPRGERPVARRARGRRAVLALPAVGALALCCRRAAAPCWARPQTGAALRTAARPRAARAAGEGAGRQEGAAPDAGRGADAAQRSSFDDSPGWVKAVVSGLTSAVNAAMGDQPELSGSRTRKFERISSEMLLAGVREDFDRQYLWTGDIDPEIYDEECVFTDPTLSFKGLSKFESNLRNLRPILDSVVPEERRKCILRSLSQDPDGRVAAEWTMLGDLALPWSPRIELGGRTTYTPGPDGRIVSYDESWDISGAEALGQILSPRARASGAEHWPGRLDGSPPPSPRVTLGGAAPPLVLLPGFGNDAEDYVAPLGQDEAVGLRACLARRGGALAVSPVSRPEWLKVFLFGLLDEGFRAGDGRAEVAFAWYLDKAKELVERRGADTGGPVVLVGHSAGGWLARALMQREGREWVARHVMGLLTLGAPHLPPPEGRFDMTMGCLRNLNEEQPGAFFRDLIFYITVAGDAVVGEQNLGDGNLPILELVQSPSTESTAFNSYRAVCGEGAVTGDSVVPLAAAHLDGATQLTLKDCVHSINVVGTTRPTDKSYLCERFVDDWLALLAKELETRAVQQVQERASA